MMSKFFCSVYFLHTPPFTSIDAWSVALTLYINQKASKTEDILFYRCKQVVNKVLLLMQYCNAILTPECRLFFPPVSV